MVSGPEAIAFKNQECPERQPDMGALRLGLAALAPLHVRDLFQAPVVLLDLPTCLGKLQPPQFLHLQIVGGPVLHRAIFGNDQEHLHHLIVL